MAKFRKKPVVIEAWLFDGTFATAHPILVQHAQWERSAPCTYRPSQKTLTIRTLEGEMTAVAGDWVIRGVKGEFYPCKPDIFEATYDRVDE